MIHQLMTSFEIQTSLRLFGSKHLNCHKNYKLQVIKSERLESSKYANV